MPAATTYTADKGYLVPGQSWFKWHYSPTDRKLDDVIEEFKYLFEGIISDQLKDSHVILPLSGGLDSRTQAAALRSIGLSVDSYSYQYSRGIKESLFASQIAAASGFQFKSLIIPDGYLMPMVEQIGRINGCYTEFTTPRQFAFLSEFEKLKGTFSLGHWGDVLFDSPSIDEEADESQMVQYVTRLICKKGGPELARTLWKVWDIEGDFDEYLRSRITDMLRKIDINNSKSKVRAFKSLYWAPRWTSINLSAFSKNHEISLPYYHERICAFICTIPESMLSGRQIQIEYLKRYAPDLANITWQDHRPFNLFTYKYDRFPYNLGYRISDKIRRSLSTQPFTLRNWEIQFSGQINAQLIQEWIHKPDFKFFVPETVSTKVLSKFSHNPDAYSAHGLSMLLTLAVFQSLERPALR